MGLRTAPQELVFHNFGVDDLNAATLSDTEWDTKGLSSYTVLCAGGNAVGAAVSAFSVHASDTTGFTPGAGNKIGEITSGLPDAAKEMVAVDVTDGPTQGRYVQVIATAGAAATDLAVIGIGIPANDGRKFDATDRGLTADALA